MGERITIGIGVTTFNRPECLAKWKEQIKKHTYYYKADVRVYIAEDTDADRKGVAARKNQCLRALKDCDYVFLFDDDCWPIKDGWIDFFVKYTSVPTAHFLYLNDTLHGKTNNHTNNAYVYNNCGGVFMSLTKGAINNVGAFNERFDLWGFEHAEYSQRVSEAGFNYSPYLCLKGTEEYLYSADYSDPNHKSSISNEEKQKYFDLNFPKFKEPIKQIYIPL